MRVILRNPIAEDGRDFRHSLTVGREYEVLGIEADDLRLLNDKNEPVLYDAVYFDTSAIGEPTFWVSTQGEEGERYAGPLEWTNPGYFEDWHDGITETIAGFWADLKRLYPWTAKIRGIMR
ncbi:MAG: hypothetical protein C0478_14580 [Planctomyces sp.]|nr:hypothetical protein [Planctomyces sp.]